MGFVTRIADVLGQLLLAEDAIELQTVKRTFLTLFDLHIWPTFGALFTQIREGDAELRQKGIEYLKSQISNLWEKIKQKNGYKYLIEGIKNCIEKQDGMTSLEFKTCLRLLSRLFTSYDSKILASEIGKLALKKSNLDQEFAVKNEEYISKFLSCFSLTNSLANLGVDTNPFMVYFIKKIALIFDQLSEKKNLAMLNAVTDCSKHITASTAADSIEPIYLLMEKYMPKRKTKLTINNISIVASLLIIFQKLVAKDEKIALHIWSKALKGEVPKDKTDLRNDFKERLSFLQNNLKSYMSEMRNISQSTRARLNKASDKEQMITLSEKRKDTQTKIKKASDLQTNIKNFLQNKVQTTTLSKKQKLLTPKGM